ncbi:uncharacterized protein G2W53_043831 [Senna tora]|uniref:Uncharacterized protein n=1 Tax=Senna tora TaxID=362788 RepID=A0A834SLV1_9FABA|nr:uncharacterized protein G2W53_043831 [Senna tora]
MEYEQGNIWNYLFTTRYDLEAKREIKNARQPASRNVVYQNKVSFSIRTQKRAVIGE